MGFPEARINLAQAVIHLSLSPESNAVVVAIDEAMADVRSGLVGGAIHLRHAHGKGARELRHGKGYKYAHDHPGGVAEQQYAPDVVHGKEYDRPTRHGAEGRFTEVLDRIRAVLRGGRS